MSTTITYPGIRGQLRVFVATHEGEEGRVYIEGDTAGLRSLGELLVKLASVDQKALPGLPSSGASEHIHLDRDEWLTPQSAPEVVLGRLDDKSGHFDETFIPRIEPPPGNLIHRV